jgi:hypothetical protein
MARAMAAKGERGKWPAGAGSRCWGTLALRRLGFLCADSLRLTQHTAHTATQYIKSLPFSYRGLMPLRLFCICTHVRTVACN